MDGFQFVASLFQSLVSLAWPAALVICVWLFREKIAELLPRMRAKYKDLEFSFLLDEAEKVAVKMEPPTESSEPTPEEEGRFESIANLNPRAAMLSLRYELEEAVRRFADAVGVNRVSERIARRPNSLAEYTRVLRQNELIDVATANVLDDLRSVGNAAAHSEDEPTTEDAMRFRSLAQRLIDQLNIVTAAALANRGPAPLP